MLQISIKSRADIMSDVTEKHFQIEFKEVEATLQSAGK